MPRKPARSKKDKVLHTRVPEQVEAALRRRAEELRIPLSSLIRNILEDTLHFVDNLVSDGLAIADTVRKDALHVARTAREGAEKLKGPKEAIAGEPRPRVPPRAKVLGWQELILERGVSCAFCGVRLERGSRAMMGVGGAGSPPFACRSCLGAARGSRGATKPRHRH